MSRRLILLAAAGGLVILAGVVAVVLRGPGPDAGRAAVHGPLSARATSRVRPLAGTTPVLFVHGINSGPGVWQPASPSSISGQAAAIAGVTAWTFSYARQSLDWVTRQQIGPDLAAAIGCLATLSGHKVIIVGHSMGGLAAQYAIGEKNSPAAGHAAELITIGTPFDGSQILTDAERAINDGGLAYAGNPGVALAEAILSLCAGVADHTDANLCGLASVLRSPVGTALEAHSADIEGLPAWPAGFPVYDTAGDMKVSMLGRDFDFGDGAVTLSSATAHDTTGSPDIVPCAKTLLNIREIDKNLCFHTSLPRNPAIITAVLAAIRANLLPAQPWTSGELTITPDSLGAVTIGMTIPQASAAAGVQLIQTGDGVYIGQGGTPRGLSVEGARVACVAAQDTPGVPSVLTPQGFPLGGTLAQLKAVYGSSLRFVPAPQEGMTPNPGYVASFPDGNLAFLVGNGTAFRKGTIYMIVGGPGVLPSTPCA